MADNCNWLNVLPQTSPVIVLGMHRSGTSLLTRLLAECGIFFGNDLDRNHESRTFKKLNEFLMNSVGGNWDYPGPLKVLEKDKVLRELYLKYLRGQIESPRCFGYIGWRGLLKEKPICWGWKDPRNTFTLGIWHELYPNSKMIILERHGLDVALSLTKRRKQYLIENKNKLECRRMFYDLFGKRGTFVDTARCWSLVEAVKLWFEYTVKARAELRKFSERSLLIKYEDFLSGPENCIDKVINFVGVNSSEKVLSEICSEVNPQRAFAYRFSEIVQRLDPIEKKVIEDFLAPIGYVLD